MANIDTNTFQHSANLSLWFKLRTGDEFTLADVPEIIPLRWNYFRDNWPFLEQNLLRLANNTQDPDYFRETLINLTTFIDRQKSSTTDVNPFSGSEVYYRFYPVFNAILINEINLTNEEETLVFEKKTNVQNFSKNDFLAMKRAITAYRDNVADLVGLSDADYNRIYDRNGNVSAVEATIVDISLMLVLQKQLDSLNFILANLFAVDSAIDPFMLARQNANNPEINIGQYSSGFLVKLHYGESLQSLANRYFKDPNKWVDIAIANGLKPPYIDETGEKIFFLSNGNGNQLNIAALDSNGNSNINKVHINQMVYIQSTTERFPSQRLITGIKELPLSGEIVITLNGDGNLGNYLLDDDASIRIFQSNTINSSQYILIPSTIPLDNNRSDEIPWFQASSDIDEKNTKIDLAVGDGGELLFTPNGDLALSYNLANAIQSIKLRFSTELGSNLYHPAYGIVNLVGTRNLGIEETKEQLIESIRSQIQSDSRFERIESLSVEQRADTPHHPVAFYINLVVRLVGGNTLLPISFTIAT